MYHGSNLIKGNVDIISSNPLFIEINVRFLTVTFRTVYRLSVENAIKIINF